jgi:uncharacterized repeat protein (TIGR01451 family)
VLAVADVGVRKIDLGATPDAGETMTYRITVGNGGPSVATGVVMTDTLPLELTVTNIAAPAGTSCTTVQGAAGNEQVVCNYGDLGVGESVDVVLTVEVDPDTPGGAILFNQAVASAEQIDLDNSDNRDGEQTPVTAAAELSISKADDPDPVTAGELLEYTLMVGNAGPSTADDVVITDELPDGLTFEGAIGDGACETLPNGTVRCELGDLAPGEDAEVTILARVASDVACGSALSNTATVDSNTPDPGVSPNTATAAPTSIASWSWSCASSATRRRRWPARSSATRSRSRTWARRTPSTSR